MLVLLNRLVTSWRSKIGQYLSKFIERSNEWSLLAGATGTDSIFVGHTRVSWSRSKMRRHLKDRWKNVWLRHAERSWPIGEGRFGAGIEWDSIGSNKLWVEIEEMEDDAGKERERQTNLFSWRSSLRIELTREIRCIGHRRIYQFTQWILSAFEKIQSLTGFNGSLVSHGHCR